MEHACVPDFSLGVYLILNFRSQSFELVKLLLMHLAKGDVSPPPGADYSLRIRFKTTVAILAVVQRLLSYNTCCGFQLLRSDSFSWLLHLPGNIEFAGSKSRGRILQTGETHFRRCFKPNLYFFL